jgi:hypothetical protein
MRQYHTDYRASRADHHPSLQLSPLHTSRKSVAKPRFSAAC